MRFRLGAGEELQIPERLDVGSLDPHCRVCLGDNGYRRVSGDRERVRLRRPVARRRSVARLGQDKLGPGDQPALVLARKNTARQIP